MPRIGLGLGLGLRQASGGVAPYVGLLDTYPSAAAAYSIRLLRSAYTGNAIRVRRSSDNAESDIGFTALGDLDTTALTTFCSGTDGFVTTWYDQSGNAYNATQGTAANQPQIVSSGAVLTTNGKPSANFDGSNDSLFTTGTPFSATETTLIAVSKLNNVGPYLRLFSIGAYNNGRYLGSNTFTDDMLAIFNNTTLTCFGGVAITQNVSIMYNTGTNGVLWQNGSQVNTVGANDSSYGNENLYIGSDKVQESVELWKGIGQEFIFYPSSQSSNVSGIGSNINTYYGIY
jgi:hypothetical protein